MFRTLSQRRRAVGGVLMAAACVVAGTRFAFSSDHADTPQIAAAPGSDLTDVFCFPSPTDPDKVVLAMCVSPLIPAGQAATRTFDPDTLYQFKIDNTGDGVEDRVIQFRFGPSGTAQRVQVAGPAAPPLTGTVSRALNSHATTGTIGASFQPVADMTVFAGAREDPFFIDLERFFEILPDRGSPIFPNLLQPAGEENIPRQTSWRSPADAKDFLKDLNLLAIVVELPRAQLRGTADGKIRLWCTTSQ